MYSGPHYRKKDRWLGSEARSTNSKIHIDRTAGIDQNPQAIFATTWIIYPTYQSDLSIRRSDVAQ